MVKTKARRKRCFICKQLKSPDEVVTILHKDGKSAKEKIVYICPHHDRTRGEHKHGQDVL